MTLKRDPQDEQKGPVAKLFMLLFALAGLGLGVWVFRRKRNVPRPR